MRYLNTFENHNESIPKTGDYVVLHADSFNKEYNNFINNTIGRIYKVSKRFIYIKYGYVPHGIKQWFNNEKTSAEFSDIDIIGKTKEEVEEKLNANKYNL